VTQGKWERGVVKPPENEKPRSFGEDLEGNLMPATLDGHNTRSLGMRSGNPEYLANDIRELIKPKDWQPFGSIKKYIRSLPERSPLSTLRGDQAG
jgi:hypothetical protein